MNGIGELEELEELMAYGGNVALGRLDIIRKVLFNDSQNFIRKNRATVTNNLKYFLPSPIFCQRVPTTRTVDFPTALRQVVRHAQKTDPE
jgi:hypothetical protein